MADKLVEIKPEHWQMLRDIFQPIDSMNYLSRCLLDYYIRWLEQDSNSLDIVLYSLNGDWSDGTFLAVWETHNVRIITMEKNVCKKLIHQCFFLQRRTNIPFTSTVQKNHNS